MNVVEWLDRGGENVVAGMHRPWLDSLAIAVTHLGGAAVIASLAILILIVLLILRRWRTAACIGAAVAMAFLIGEIVKDEVNRKRPDMPWRVVALPISASFPSGHSLNSMTLYGALALTIGRRLRRRWLRTLALVIGLGLPLLIGCSRVYLGVHFFTDVLAGWAIGLVLIFLAGWADLRMERNPTS